MAMTDVRDVLHEHWAEVQEHLDEPTRAAVVALLDAPSADPERTARRIVRLVLAALPDGHPVRAALEDSVRYSRAVRVESANRDAVLQVLDLVLGRSTDGGGPETPAEADPQPVPVPPDDADDWLLAADSVSAADYRAGGHDPADPDLIRLTDRQGAVRLPSFQFDGASGRPLPVVVAVNRLLDADDDPWGVADWWLGANAWLDAVPARLLGTPGEHGLLAAARAEIAEW
ncbi:DUF3168 domain-containing protein [Kitasatospora purpeofusca]|uniref:DUF3168 domain-containing protein n=1 Tax=Kitasatospora purpeofusca TaxID=67352 RepID=UPI002A5AC326|nr:DUF3168 domain-containing protein [Kitasatospora purpeofusca]MDY0810691.1 DUF3168 domain-containing protein [Kitasatospora purpeofusca]